MTSRFAGSVEAVNELSSEHIPLLEKETFAKRGIEL
jgi:hypothetical protein